MGSRSIDKKSGDDMEAAGFVCYEFVIVVEYRMLAEHRLLIISLHKYVIKENVV